MSGARGIPLLTLAGGVSAGLGYAWTIVVGRLVSTAQYADFSAGAAIIYFAVTALSPLAQTMSYFVATSGASGALQRRLLFIALASGGLLVSLAVLFATPLAHLLRFGSPKDVVVIAVCLLTTAALNVRRGVQLGELRWTAYAWNIVIEPGFRVAFVWIALLFRPSSTAALGSFVVSTAIATAIAGRWRFGDADKIDLGAVGRYLAPAVAYTAVFAAIQNLDVIVAKRALAPADAGAYGAASLLARAAGMLVLPFYALAVPHLVEVADQPAEMRRRLIRMCAQYGVLAGAAVAFFSVASRPIVGLLFGERYAGGAPLLLPLSLAIATTGLTFLLCQLPVALNRFSFVPAYAFGLVIEVVLLALWHPAPSTVAWVAVAANVVTLLLVIPFARRLPSPRTPAAAGSG